ncbi:hypothetical protein [Mycobacterium sp. SM1]|uniref:hypothetical protein n=1 Tax=Mycobacterium sp. SM1 TaxID=2816243 RepID=UPI001F3E754F|nr:hypothetical protein [Mycobacterium sp. SM1]
MRGYDVSHLVEHAAHWRELAERRRSVVGAINAQANALDWVGQGDEAMTATMARHLSTAEEEAGLLDAAAQSAEGGASVLHRQQQALLSGVDQAHRSGFAVGEDWMAHDAMYPPGSMGWYARQPTAQAISATLRAQAGAFAAQEFQIATDVVSAAADLGGEGAVHRHIEAVAATTARQVPNAAVPPPPGPSARSVIDALTGADRLLRYLSPPHMSTPPPAQVSPTPAGSAVAGIRTQLWPLLPGGGVLSAAGGGGIGVAGAGPAGGAAAPGGGVLAMLAQAGTGATSAATKVITTPAALGAAWTAGVIAASPVAHIQSDPLPPSPSPPVQFADPGHAQQEHAPQPPPSTDASQTPRPPQAQPSAATPAPVAPASTGGPGPVPADGAPAPNTGGGGAQMLGFGPAGLGPAPQAPRLPLPLDPTPPVPPPVPPIDEMTKEQALAAYVKLKEDLARYSDDCLKRPFVLPQEQGAYDSCVARMGELNARKAALESRLRDLGVQLGNEPAPPPTQPGAHDTQPPAQESPQIPQETPPFPPPNRVTGLTEHGAQQVNSRDGGHGVSDSAMQDTSSTRLGRPSMCRTSMAAFISTLARTRQLP